MADPRVFVSSTCYDLSEVRDHLNSFIASYGFLPALSEKGDIFFHPDYHTHESCLHEIANSQILILIIGGRFGGTYEADPKKSIVNAEFEAAREAGTPVFTFIKEDVLHDHHFYSKNKKELEKLAGLNFPSIDEQKNALHIFRFIDEVRRSPVNNGYFPFKYARDIEETLRKQWAGLFYDFLTRRSAESRVKSSLDVITQVNDRIELLSEQILQSVGSPTAKLNSVFYDIMLRYEPIRDLSYMGLRPTPATVVEHEEYEALARSLAKELDTRFEIEDRDGESSVGRGVMSRVRFDHNKEDYVSCREEILARLKKEGVEHKKFIEESTQA